MADRTALRTRVWLTPAIAAACVALELALARSGVSSTTVTASLLALVAIAVAVSLFESMNLRRERLPIRAIILIPLAFSVLATIALVIEATYRAHLVRP